MESPTNIPLVDLSIQHRRLWPSISARWAKVLEKTSFVLGPDVAEFERDFATYNAVKHCVGVGNGGDALEFALRSLDIGPGDEVVLPANTFTATAMAVLRVGATPVLVDVDSEFHLIEPSAVEHVVSEQTKAVIAVHLFGQMAPMKELGEIARRHQLFLIEDAAQSQGASQFGMRIGEETDLVATSFYPGKNLGAYGDAGAVLTNSDDLADRLRRLRNYGGIVKYEHVEPGFNSRLDTLQASVLIEKLKVLDSWNEERRRAAAVYQSLLSGIGDLTIPRERFGNHHVWHLFVVRTASRDDLLAYLNSNGIGAGIHYPTPVHSQAAFQGVAKTPLDPAMSTKLAGEILSLPIFPGITDAEISRVVEAVGNFRNFR